ncbi:MAG TPA: ATP-binding protein [Vicinamibacterales bacterium]
MNQTLAVQGTVTGVRDAVDALEAWSGRERVSEAASRRMLIALDEILSNVVRHAVHDETVLIEMILTRDADQVHVEVVDDARPFNPLLVPPPDTTSPLETREPGGLGIALVRSLTDDVRYERRGDRNRLTMTWRV